MKILIELLAGTSKGMDKAMKDYPGGFIKIITEHNNDEVQFISRDIDRIIDKILNQVGIYGTMSFCIIKVFDKHYSETFSVVMNDNIKCYRDVYDTLRKIMTVL